MDLRQINRYLERGHKALTKSFPCYGELKLGVDLGTACIVLAVVDEKDQPIAIELEYAQVVKDGLVVDYSGACRIVLKLKKSLEKRLNITLSYAAIAVPSGTGKKDANTHKYVVESAGLKIVNIVDEPTAANAVMAIKNGVIVDVGGGTTGLSIFKNGQVEYTADEATGGTHVSLVIAGNYHISFEEAETYKKNRTLTHEVFPIVRPVFEKMATIVKRHINGYHVKELCLVGGTCLFPRIEKVFSEVTGIEVIKPIDPLLVTPIGIALHCKKRGVINDA